MKRSRLRFHASELAREFEKKSYDYWASQEFPNVSERILDGEEMQVEIVLFEKDDEHMHLDVRVIGSGPFSAYFPTGEDFIVYKANE